MNWVGRLGLIAVVVGAAIVALELVMLLPLSVRLTKRLRELTLLYEDNLRLTRDELRLLSQAISETHGLLRPYRRIQRWLGHPITLALLASHHRRRASSRSQAPGR